ncbi:MAG: hypothetical protein IPK81_22315 [Rhodospirillales bacterium]|nr:MAG: hypothetical protein IPK81_22315 [Rhodospirillales bacterium]
MSVDQRESGFRVTHMKVGERLYPIGGYAEASRMFRAALARWPGRQTEVSCPDLCDADGRELGYVNLKGQCWIGQRARAFCVYEPSG